MRSIVLFLILSGCVQSHPDNITNVSINIDYNDAIEVNELDLVKDISLIQLDTSYYLRHEVLKRILLNNNRVAVLQAGASCSCADFILFDSQGNHIKTIDGFHDGNQNFAFATDITFDKELQEYKILSRNPNKIVSINLSGKITGETLLPFTETYMDFFYFNGKYLFFSDNAMFSHQNKHNILITDSEYNNMANYDPITNLQNQSFVLNKDKIFYDYTNEDFLYLPSPIIDSIYQISSLGEFKERGSIKKSQTFSNSEKRKIINSEAPFQTLMDIYRNSNILSFNIINQIYKVNDYIIIPSSHKSSRYYTIISESTNQIKTLKLDNNLLFHRIFSNSQNGYFFPIGAYSLIRTVQSNPGEWNNDKAKEIINLASHLDENDNFILVQFKWDIDFLQSFF
ncbi:6-bladed beta-propeller [Membranihabitans maritimus]|uniref:6-bladed beta-propeller n=1 Tax=Membranihabitans maritimus TaxID=2904244 RepID=UPI001F16A4A1|nr:6-bladed beta-propeller [Membranihabitans maritimus]